VGNGLIYAGGATLAPGAKYKQFAVVAFSPTGAVVAQAEANFNNGTGASQVSGLAIRPSDGKVTAAVLAGFRDPHGAGSLRKPARLGYKG
jgi:hypothetical protein